MSGEAYALFRWVHEFMTLAVTDLPGSKADRGSAFVPSLRRVALIEAIRTHTVLRSATRINSGGPTAQSVSYNWQHEAFRILKHNPTA